MNNDERAIVLLQCAIFLFFMSIGAIMISKIVERPTNPPTPHRTVVCNEGGIRDNKNNASTLKMAFFYPCSFGTISQKSVSQSVSQSVSRFIKLRTKATTTVEETIE